jgi:hypothetical protein
VQRDVLELPDDGEIVLGEERMEILEDKNGRLDLFDDLVERRERVLGGGIAVFLRLDGRAGGDDAVAEGEALDPPVRGDEGQRAAAATSPSRSASSSRCTSSASSCTCSSSFCTQALAR